MGVCVALPLPPERYNVLQKKYRTYFNRTTNAKPVNFYQNTSNKFVENMCEK